MPKLDEPEKIERNPIPVGKHALTLVAVKEHEGPNTYQPQVLNDETGEMEFPIRREWIWQFESDTVDPKTKLPLLMRHLAPDASDEERRSMIETDHLLGRRWTARLVKATSKNGKEFVTHNSFEPLEEPPFDPDEVLPT